MERKSRAECRVGDRRSGARLRVGCHRPCAINHPGGDWAGVGEDGGVTVTRLAREGQGDEIGERFGPQFADLAAQAEGVRPVGGSHADDLFG